MALMTIRDQKFYHDVLEFETFEAHCKARWDFVVLHAPQSHCFGSDV
jgi:hypothetical protein